MKRPTKLDQEIFRTKTENSVEKNHVSFDCIYLTYYILIMNVLKFKVFSY